MQKANQESKEGGIMKGLVRDEGGGFNQSRGKAVFTIDEANLGENIINVLFLRKNNVRCCTMMFNTKEMMKSQGL